MGLIYSDGTVAVTQNSDILVGTGTVFEHVGAGWIVVLEDRTVLEVKNVVNSNQLQLARPYAFASASGLRYICFPTQSVLAEVQQAIATLMQSTADLQASASSVTNTQLAPAGGKTLKGNNLPGAARPVDLTTAQVKTMLGLQIADIAGLTSQLLNLGGVNSNQPSVTRDYPTWGKALRTVKRTFDTVLMPTDFIWKGGTAGPIIDAPDAASGTSKALSFPIPAGDNADLWFEIPMRADEDNSLVRIRYHTQGEPNYDGLRINLDGNQVFEDRGNNPDYKEWTFNLSAGAHVLRLRYTSDYTTQIGFQNCRFSEITYPAELAISPYKHGDTVHHNDKLWFCLEPFTSDEPGTGDGWVEFGGGSGDGTGGGGTGGPGSGSIAHGAAVGPHRYWRIRSLAALGQIGINEVEMTNAAGGPDLCTGGTALTDTTYGGYYGADKAFNNDLTSSNGAWAGSNSFGYIGYDFGEGKAYEITEVRVCGFADEQGITPRLFAVEYSDDLSAWKVSWYGYNENWPYQQFVTFARPRESRANECWAILNEVSNYRTDYQDMVISEMQMRTLAGGLNEAFDGLAIGYPYQGGSEPSRAFDGNFGSEYYAGRFPKAALVGYKWSAPKSIGEIAITGNANNGNMNRAPGTGWIVYSQDGKNFLRACPYEAIYTDLATKLSITMALGSSQGDTGDDLGMIKLSKPGSPAVETNARHLILGKGLAFESVLPPVFDKGVLVPSPVTIQTTGIEFSKRTTSDTSLGLSRKLVVKGSATLASDNSSGENVVVLTINDTTPAGGQTGQYLGKRSNADGDFTWLQPHEVPAGGVSGQFLGKNNSQDYDHSWITVHQVPAGGDSRFVLRKWSGNDHEYSWQKVEEVPPGGTTKQVLSKKSDADYDTEWRNEEGLIRHLDVFFESGTWTKRPGALNVKVTAIGAGQGGRGGNAGNSINGRAGGKGGAGGAFTVQHYEAVDLPETVAITIASPTLGTAGAINPVSPPGVWTNQNQVNNGATAPAGPGLPSASSFGNFVIVGPGALSGFPVGSGGDVGAGATSAAGSSTGTAGGGGGGYIGNTVNSSNQIVATGAAGGSGCIPMRTSGVTGGAASQTGKATNGSNGYDIQPNRNFQPGAGGGGGGAAANDEIDLVGGDGGNGGYGAGGGGGGAGSHQGGKGGNGGPSVVWVETWCSL